MGTGPGMSLISIGVRKQSLGPKGRQGIRRQVTCNSGCDLGPTDVQFVVTVTVVLVLVLGLGCGSP